MIKLQKVKRNELQVVHQLQIESFKTLLQKYQDYDTNPGAEPLEKIVNRFAIISDIHGNIHALQAVLKELENQSIDSYFSLGDNFGNLPYPIEVAELLRKQSKSVVIGGNLDYLMNVEQTMTLKV